MTPAALKSARRVLGLSARGMAAAVGVASGRTVRRWEAGERPVAGYVVLLITRLLAEHAAA